jgi:hypothetical protein
MENRQLITHSIRKIEDRTIEFVISDGTVDAHRSILNPAGWDLKRFQKNGIFGYMHRVTDETDPDFILGPASAYIEGDKLIGVAKFEPEEVNQLAERIYKKVKAGTLKAVSVGFLPLESHREGDVVVYDKMELLEFSIVNIPSNPNAVKRTFAENKKKYNLLNYL